MGRQNNPVQVAHSLLCTQSPCKDEHEVQDKQEIGSIFGSFTEFKLTRLIKAVAKSFIYLGKREKCIILFLAPE